VADAHLQRLIEQRGLIHAIRDWKRKHQGVHQDELPVFDMKGMTFRGLDVRAGTNKLVLSKADLTDTIWEDVYLDQLDILNTKVHGCKMLNVRINNCRMEDLEGDGFYLTDCRLSKITLNRSRFRTSCWLRVFADMLVWENGAFVKGILRECNFSGAKLNDLVLQYTTMTPALVDGQRNLFARAILAGADLSGAKIDPDDFKTADMTGAMIPVKKPRKKSGRSTQAPASAPP